MEGKRGSECLLKSVSNIDFNPEQTEELLKTFADYVNAHKPNKLKNDQPNN